MDLQVRPQNLIKDTLGLSENLERVRLLLDEAGCTVRSILGRSPPGIRLGVPGPATQDGGGQEQRKADQLLIGLPYFTLAFQLTPAPGRPGS